MRVFEIMLPVHDNNGKAYRGAHEAFSAIIVQRFGGYTKRPSGEGAWRDDATGQVHYDTMVPYRIGVELDHPDMEAGVLSALAGIAGPLFPDQKAFYTRRLHGSARIITNAGPVRHPDRATRQGGKTDQAFDTAASAPPMGSEELPAKSCNRPSWLKPFEYHVAGAVLAASEKDRARLSQLNWALSEAMRNYDKGESFEPVRAALFALSVAIA